MGVCDIFGNALAVNSAAKSGTVVDTEVYENNLKQVFGEKFTAVNNAFTLTNCSVSGAGLSCTGFCKAVYNHAVNLLYEKAIARFTYSEGLTVGVFLSSTLGYIDTANKTVSLYTGYGQAETLPDTANSTGAFAFDLVPGNEYILSLDKRAHDYATVTFRDTVTGNEFTVSGGSSNSRGSKTVGVVVFSGATTVNDLIYKTPLYKHAKALICGDSITWGGSVSDYKDCYAWKLLTDYFHNDCVICGYGGEAINGGIAKVTELFNQGYTFDYVIMALGTNVDWPRSVNWDYATQIAARREQFDEFKALCNSHGAELLWGAPPASKGYTLDVSLEEAEADTSTTGYPSAQILRKLILDYFGEKAIRFDYATATDGAYDSAYFADGLHPNEAGYARMTEFAKSALEILNVT